MPGTIVNGAITCKAKAERKPLFAGCGVLKSQPESSGAQDFCPSDPRQSVGIVVGEVVVGPFFWPTRIIGRQILAHGWSTWLLQGLLDYYKIDEPFSEFQRRELVVIIKVHDDALPRQTPDVTNYAVEIRRSTFI